MKRWQVTGICVCVGGGEGGVDGCVYESYFASKARAIAPDA